VPGSSVDCCISVSHNSPPKKFSPAAGVPRTMNGLKLSNVPAETEFSVPPFGASGLT
jgi:hypothetical protein